MFDTQHIDSTNQELTLAPKVVEPRKRYYKTINFFSLHWLILKEMKKRETQTSSLNWIMKIVDGMGW